MSTNIEGHRCHTRINATPRLMTAERIPYREEVVFGPGSFLVELPDGKAEPLIGLHRQDYEP